DEYKAEIDGLRARLFSLQRRCWSVGLGALIVLEGWHAAGKGKIINTLTSRLEPRAFEIHSIRDRRTHEKPLPWLYRFWLAIPAYGRIAIFDRSWNRRVLVHGLDGTLDDVDVEQAFDDINDFERALYDDRYTVIKFFLHIDRQCQRDRFEKLASDEATSWRVDDDWEQNERYDEHLAVIEELLARTETEWAPWHVVAAYDIRRARVQVIDTVVQRLAGALAHHGFEDEDGAGTGGR
ncbi:MAG: hypothetical protein PVJ49_09450, partial [Acidobacteriota bacterium]